MPNIFIADTCDGYSDLYVSKSGRNTPGCGTKWTPCLNLTNALTAYHSQTHKQWLACVIIHMDSSQQVDGLNNTGLQGFGNPLLQYGNHSVVRFIRSSKVTSNVSLTVRGTQLKHVKFQVEGITSLIVEKCMFDDSKLFVNKSKSLSITGVSWYKAENTSVLQVHNVASVGIQSSFVSDINITMPPDLYSYTALAIYNPPLGCALALAKRNL